jgi:hypothetical protein
MSAWVLLFEKVRGSRHWDLVFGVWDSSTGDWKLELGFVLSSFLYRDQQEVELLVGVSGFWAARHTHKLRSSGAGFGVSVFILSVSCIMVRVGL